MCAVGVHDICDYLNNRGTGRTWQTPTEAQHLASEGNVCIERAASNLNLSVDEGSGKTQR